jgi:hypothetical protein
MARLTASTPNTWVCPYCGHAHPSPWPDRIVWAFMTIDAPTDGDVADGKRSS